jgi:hypothetical protein
MNPYPLLVKVAGRAEISVMACLLMGFITQNNDFWFLASTKAYDKPSLHLTLLSLASPGGFEPVAEPYYQLARIPLYFP